MRPESNIAGRASLITMSQVTSISNTLGASKCVLMVSTSYPADLNDWRGLFIRHLAEALARRSDVRLLLWSPPGVIPENSEYVATPKEAHWLSELMESGGIAHRLRSRPIRSAATPIRLLIALRNLYRRENNIEIYHVNWLQNSLMLPRNSTPLLVSVLGTDLQMLKIPGVTQRLRQVFKCRHVIICPNADWMVPELARLFDGFAQIRAVPFGIEPRWFAVQRGDRNQCHKWLCVSRLTPGKIGRLFDWAAPFFSDSRRELHLFGPMQQAMSVPAWVHYHGPATPESLCDDWFPQAAGLITLSQHAEGRPQVMLEAMAAGLPVIASYLPAHVDLLRHGDTGWICKVREDVPQALEALENEAMNRAIGLRAKAWVQAVIGTWDDCATRYATLYDDLLDGRRP